MKQKDFVLNLCILLFLNLLVKPFWILGIDVGVQNQVGAAEYGLYFAVFNFSYMFYMLLDMGICNFNNRNIARNNQLLDKHLSSILVLRFLLCIVYFVVIYAVALLIGYRGVQLKLLFWVGFNQFLNATMLYLRSNVSALMMFKTDSFLSVLDRLLAILFCGMLLWGHVTDEPFRIEWFVYSQTAAYLIAIAVALAIVLWKSKLRKLTWDKAFFLLILKKSLPFALLTFLMAIYNRIDPVMIERILPGDISSTQAGIYASAFRLLDALVMIAYLFSVILLPLFSKMLKEKENVVPIVRTAFSLLYLYAVTMVVVLSVYREPVMQILYADHVSESVQVFSVLICGLIPISFTYVFGTLLTANGNLRKLNVTAVVGILINILLNLILIPHWHARGAAITSLCTQSVVSLLQWIIAMRELKVPFRSLPWISTLLFTALLVPMTILSARWLDFSHVCPSRPGVALLLSLLVVSVASLVIGVVTRLVRVSEAKHLI
ncbi:MAG: polysaccharide biosynthesis C-terminal domain-containing protein [Bacteroidales bacterium]|nr:polysaccharide biosynthesis C-terminal domain-containing protein [Bacteroidales bacterium]